MTIGLPRAPILLRRNVDRLNAFRMSEVQPKGIPACRDISASALRLLARSMAPPKCAAVPAAAAPTISTLACAIATASIVGSTSVAPIRIATPVRASPAPYPFYYPFHYEPPYVTNGPNYGRMPAL